MTRDQLLNELKALITPYLNAEQLPKLDALTQDTVLTTDLGLDSVDLVDIVINAETKYGIQIENETIATMTSVGKCIEVIEAKVAAKV